MAETDGKPGRDCPRCPRLVAFRKTWRAKESAWFNSPVPSFGSINGRLLIVGLAPGLQGANRTGRPFTGDYAGVLLYETLGKYGFARGEYHAHPDDGLELVDCRITNAVRCVPPENKPTPEEIRTCRDFLTPTIGEMKKLRAIVALGRIAHESTVRALGGRLADASVCARQEARARPNCAVLQLPLLALQHEHRRAYPRNVPGGLRNCAPLPRLLKPGDHLRGILVRRKDGIEHLCDLAVIDNKRHALEQRHARDRECRELQCICQRQFLVRQQSRMADAGASLLHADRPCPASKDRRAAPRQAA